jgi:ankyrin repeat protein
MGMLLGVSTIGLCSAICFTADHSSVTKHVDKVYLAKALVSAAESGDIPSMTALLQKGAEVNRNAVPSGENALFAATKNNQTAAAKWLLENGASIDTGNSSGIRPMDWALATGNLSMAELFHDKGARISEGAWAAATDDIVQLDHVLAKDVVDNEKIDEMMRCAVSMGNLDAVQILEKKTGKAIAGHFLKDAAGAGNLSMMKYIFKQGADIQKDGPEAMQQAVLFYDQPLAAKLLMEHGVDPNQMTRWEKFLISEAQSAAMVKVLLDAGANPNSVDRWGTPLSEAPDPESVRLLVQHGANLHPQLPHGMSLIECAILYDRRDNADVIRELIRQGATFDPKKNGQDALAWAASRNKSETIKYLLQMGVSPNAFAPFLRSSVVRSAVSKSSIDAVKLLLEQGGAALGDSRDDGTPFSLALLAGNEDMLKLLREGGARPESDLSLAAALGNPKEVNYLINKGFDVNQTDEQGHTPLFYALRSGQSETARLLIQHGAVVSGSEINPNGR